jgi:hypothetical protein
MTHWNIPEIKSPAEHAKDALIDGLRSFEDRLGENEEMVIDADGLPAGHRVFALGAAGSFIVFYSSGPDECKAQTYISVMGARVTIRAQPKPDDIDEARRIGFHTPG